MEKKNSTKLKKPLLVLVLGVIVIEIAISRGRATQNSEVKGVAYLKGNSWYYYSVEEDKTLVLTDCVVKERESSELQDITSRATLGASAYTYCSTDGKIVVYPKDINENVRSYTLCSCNVEAEEEDIIDQDVSSYKMNENADVYAYIKGSNQTLYQKTTNGTMKVAEKVREYYISKDGSELHYLLDNKECYVKRDSKEQELIDTDVTSLLKVYETGEVYYFKGSGNPEEGPLLSSSLFYYDGEQKKEVVKELYYDDILCEIALDKPAMVYLSDGALYGVVENEVMEIEEIDQFYAHISPNGETLYYYMPNGEAYDLYQVELKKGSKPAPAEYEKQVSQMGQFLSNNLYVYFRNVDFEMYSGEMYIDKKLVADSACYLGMYYYEDENELLYARLSENPRYADVLSYNFKDSKLLINDSEGYTPLNASQILTSSALDETYQIDLCNDGEKQLIDESVSDATVVGPYKEPQ